MYIYGGGGGGGGAAVGWRDAGAGVVPPDPVQTNWTGSVEYRGCMLLIGE